MLWMATYWYPFDVVYNSWDLNQTSLFWKSTNYHSICTISPLMLSLEVALTHLSGNICKLSQLLHTQIPWRNRNAFRWCCECEISLTQSCFWYLCIMVQYNRVMQTMAKSVYRLDFYLKNASHILRTVKCLSDVSIDHVTFQWTTFSVGLPGVRYLWSLSQRMLTNDSLNAHCKSMGV